MDTDKVIQDLNKRFSSPLPDYYERRIIFWFDEDREFEDKLDDVELENAKLVRLTGCNQFAVKKLLGSDDKYSNYVVYCPVAHERLADNWLLDVELYSEEFRADLISLWMDEMSLPNQTSMREVVKQYRKFFNAKERRNRIARLQGGKFRIATRDNLHLAVLAAICNLDSLHPAGIVKAVLSAGLDKDTNVLYRDLVNYEAEDSFLSLASQATGFSEAEMDLSHLACQLMLTAATRTLNDTHLRGLERFISIPHQAWCFDLVSAWLKSPEQEDLYRIAQHVEDTLLLYDRFEQLPVQALLETESFPCINICILKKLTDDIRNNIIDVEAIRGAVEKRRTCAWYDKHSSHFEAVLEVAHMQQFYLEHVTGFHTVEANSVWEEYTGGFYRMDTYYRHFHLHYANILKSFDSLLSDHFTYVADKVERLYVHWFLGSLAENWTKACEEDLKHFGHVQKVSRQKYFYRDEVETSSTNVVVIISDALRYEVAAELEKKLRQHAQAKVELKSMQATFPTITKFGMAALLPHKKLSIEEKSEGDVAVLADGNPTDSPYRDKILKQANRNSVALQYTDIIGLKTDELRELSKGMDVIYIYHDTIDSSSHASENFVFEACDETIRELENLVRISINRMNRTHVIITSDHGFLYTHNPLQEHSKVDKTSFNGMDVEYGRRYAIMKKGASPDYLMPVKFLDEDSGLTAFAPRENIRIKKSGSGLNYVHGGVSLQEMCVPVLTYQRLRSESKEYLRNPDRYDTRPVEIKLYSSERKTSNLILSLDFFQTEAMGDKRTKRTYHLYFTDESDTPISDTQIIIADKTSEDIHERTTRLTFNLRQMQYDNTATYYLVIADEQGLMMPQRIAFQIDIPFSIAGFDFSF